MMSLLRLTFYRYAPIKANPVKFTLHDNPYLKMNKKMTKLDHRHTPFL